MQIIFTGMSIVVGEVPILSPVPMSFPILLHNAYLDDERDIYMVIHLFAKNKRRISDPRHNEIRYDRLLHLTESDWSSYGNCKYLSQPRSIRMECHIKDDP